MQKFPNDLRKLKSRPFSKKSEATDSFNYRPIFITPTLAKLFERLMQNQMTDYLERKKHFHLVNSASTKLVSSRCRS